MQKQIQIMMKDHLEAIRHINNSTFIQQIEDVANSIINAIESGNKIMIFGNGGSAADAQHFAAELMCRLEKNRQPYPAIALTTDTSFLTAHINDFGHEEIFSRQIAGLGQPGDIAIGISTSGKSVNILLALSAAKHKNIVTVGLLGRDGGGAKSFCDHNLIIPVKTTTRIQECHELIYHIICKLVEEKLTTKNTKEDEVK